MQNDSHEPCSKKRLRFLKERKGRIYSLLTMYNGGIYILDRDFLDGDLLNRDLLDGDLLNSALLALGGDHRLGCDLN